MKAKKLFAFLCKLLSRKYFHCIILARDRKIWHFLWICYKSNYSVWTFPGGWAQVHSTLQRGSDAPPVSPRGANAQQHFTGWRGKSWQPLRRLCQGPVLGPHSWAWRMCFHPQEMLALCALPQPLFLCVLLVGCALSWYSGTLMGLIPLLLNETLE